MLVSAEMNNDGDADGDDDGDGDECRDTMLKSALYCSSWTGHGITHTNYQNSFLNKF